MKYDYAIEILLIEIENIKQYSYEIKEAKEMAEKEIAELESAIEILKEKSK